MMIFDQKSMLYTPGLAVHLVRSFNQPKFSSNASWNPNATTFARSSIVGSYPYAIFVNTNNTVVVVNRENGGILVWHNASVNQRTTIFANLSYPLSMFVSSDDEIFVDNVYTHNRVDRWTLNGAQLPSPMSTCYRCFGLFVDIHNNLYCSQYTAHQVVRTSLNNPDSALTIVAGTGCWGSTSTTLSYPIGIFVTANLELYVADYWNDRIQLFQRGERRGTTVIGNGSNRTITLLHPTGVVLDGDGYLFIVDQGNHRIVGSGPHGYRCVVGCFGSGGPSSNQLNNPQTMSFDTNGNIFVADKGNNRIQKFVFCNDTCGE
jgi:hypothetical protein